MLLCETPYSISRLASSQCASFQSKVLLVDYIYKTFNTKMKLFPEAVCTNHRMVVGFRALHRSHTDVNDTSPTTDRLNNCITSYDQESVDLASVWSRSSGVTRSVSLRTKVASFAISVSLTTVEAQDVSCG